MRLKIKWPKIDFDRRFCSNLENWILFFVFNLWPMSLPLSHVILPLHPFRMHSKLWAFSLEPIGALTSIPSEIFRIYSEFYPNSDNAFNWNVMKCHKCWHFSTNISRNGIANELIEKKRKYSIENSFIWLTKSRICFLIYETNTRLKNTYQAIIYGYFYTKKGTKMLIDSPIALEYMYIIQK